MNKLEVLKSILAGSIVEVGLKLYKYDSKPMKFNIVVQELIGKHLILLSMGFYNGKTGIY
ncbi:hypothetical protein P9E76_12010 [Schinkia azotoformans]|uniref:hypothetical protein n=1 Tax=Schinkia azotoformans TaxID=1454 RepID=UPI00031D737F|nr:hypothetical protein [Schinkia azotoformans]MEC1639179.1 hypothetical protein [Schinkia azotoformans]MEC1722539.1 hypothetical protein [Schinkia azotoformans]MEC1945767.1 hypothetical protein [Schinkia azotoformans]MED4415770.1 hypothetical protein [Schinkia azotoformans]